MGDLAQFMVSQDIPLKEISDRVKELEFPDNVVQYLRGDICVPPGGLLKLL